jgi:hypothetical protein
VFDRKRVDLDNPRIQLGPPEQAGGTGRQPRILQESSTPSPRPRLWKVTTGAGSYRQDRCEGRACRRPGDNPDCGEATPRRSPGDRADEAQHNGTGRSSRVAQYGRAALSISSSPRRGEGEHRPSGPVAEIQSIRRFGRPVRKIVREIRQIPARFARRRCGAGAQIRERAAMSRRRPNLRRVASPRPIPPSSGHRARHCPHGRRGSAADCDQRGGLRTATLGFTVAIVGCREIAGGSSAGEMAPNRLRNNGPCTKVPTPDPLPPLRQPTE